MTGIENSTSTEIPPTKGKGKAVEEDIVVEKPKPANQVAVEYQLKAIEWIEPSGKVRKLKVITQNENGPCPLLALCNVLLLRGDIEIKPYDRPTVTYDFLVELLGDYLLKSIPQGEAEIQKRLQVTNGTLSPKQEEKERESQPKNNTNGIEDITNKVQCIALEDGVTDKGNHQPNGDFDLTRPSLQDYHHTLNAALSIIPSLQTGLDVNVRFNSIHGFEPTAELSVFDVFHVDLVHGWVVDPQDEDTWKVVVGKCSSYNRAVECVVGGDSVSKGIVVESSNKASNNGFEDSQGTLNDEDSVRVRDALITSSFLESTATQLTYHVTDAGFVHERSVVWESLIDVDQNASEFVNGQFQKGEATGGDYVDVIEEHNDLMGVMRWL
ncbi:16160_t:CDS:2 [Funneliformis caledonium]|uniref:16160_t:CDS:1 n=1 Tax=Funneliformis caledonium TaxID=1117310 RepID=A0A9N9DZY5_9GLOM|nr:16160_t:CDS:2 [Funneliformis caledonium]